MNLYDKVKPDNYLFSIQSSLLQRSSAQRFPGNVEFLEALKVKDVYNIKSKNRTYLLERLENYDNKEPVLIDDNPDITIEHIFPQNPDAKWKVELGVEDYNYIKENYLNTVANLTFSGNNGKLSNKPFLEKKNLEDFGYKDSRLWLNKYLSSIEKWDRKEIEKRFDLISERCLKIWSMPNITLSEESDINEVNIFEAEAPKHKKLEYAVFFDQKLEINQVAQLYVEVLKQLFELQPETFFTTDLGAKIGLSKEPLGTKLRQAAPINDTYYIEANIDSGGKFDKIKYALTLFDFEDELSIKYAK